ncbi:hypothetical protein CDD82_7290 [Ophiocordyceps australis]|uniref:DUF7137 domain-containing protein n=1 Tax=Ophiocordyceps australis TaxID=1399860 RepID=A0A2C5YTF5_9HYPO|nr:hypothetical protein CDD82_7290 [Ophiocordyceps australis]
MRPTHSLLSLAACLAPLVSVTAAASWPRWLPEVNAVVQRADEPTTDAPASRTTVAPDSSSTPFISETAHGSTSASKSSGTFDVSAPKTTAELNTAKPTQSGKTKTETGNGKSTEVDSPEPTETESQYYPASINMTTPDPRATPGLILYKIGDNVPWAWQYLNLGKKPRAIDVVISCPIASQEWTIASNMSFKPVVDYVWDTTKQANDVEKPLLTAKCALIIKDTNAHVGDAPQPGQLGSTTALNFGLYAPQPYTPFDEWTCPGCNDASGLLDRQAIGFAVVMSVMTFFSFTWFVSGLGLD